MARKERKDNGRLGRFMGEYGVRTMEGVHNFVKMLAAETIQTVLDAEVESELRYARHNYRRKETDNGRNGYSQKTVQYCQSEMKIKVLCNRNREFEPQQIEKHQADVHS